MRAGEPPRNHGPQMPGQQPEQLAEANDEIG